MHKFIERTLWHETHNERAKLSQKDLLKQSEPLIILGEAGMGKSHLLEWIANSPGYTRCTARQLINRYDPRTLLGDAQILVVDALDEVSAQKEGDAVDLVLRKLGELGYPRFVLSCRVSDWRSATGLEAIREQYPGEPIELHLIPFNDHDAADFLSASLGADMAKEVIQHFNMRGLSDLLGNPQTLEFIARVAISGKLPETRRELFARAIEILQVEHRESTRYDQPAMDIGLDAAGAAFAGIILTGSESIVRTSPANTAEGELQLTDFSILPEGDVIRVMLGTRLFKADGTDRFSYLHRRVGEYLGARWLAKLADNPRKRRRLLSLFHSHGLVPASLRGMHAWLAGDPNLAKSVIETDPMGVIEYGDADDLTIEHARILIRALEKLAIDNPRFRNWGTAYSIRSITKPALIEDVRRLISSPETPFELSSLILDAVKGTEIVPMLAEDLRKIVLDSVAIFANRSTAGEALTDLPRTKDWTTILQTLCRYGDELSVRLAIELADHLDYEWIDDKLLADLVVSYATSGNLTFGVLASLGRNLPASRVEGVIDHLVIAVQKLGEPDGRPGNDILTDFAYHMIVRAMGVSNVSALKLWSWLEPFKVRVGYHRKSRDQFASLIGSNNQMRLAVQCHVLFELTGGGSLRRRIWSLQERSNGLVPTEEDIVALLGELDPTNRSDERWRELIQQIRHNGEKGAAVREAARPFATHRPDLLAWIDRLAVPSVAEWEIKQAKREHKRKAKEAAKRADQRKLYTASIDRMRKGDFNTILNPAKAYLKLFHDIDQDMPAHQRIEEWLGKEIATAAYEGFEAYLKQEPPNPSAQKIVEAIVEGKHYEAGFIIVSALAERLRIGVGFDDLSDERLLTGLFELCDTDIDKQADIVGLREAVESAVKSRGLWEKAMRLYYEPQLMAKRVIIHGLYSLMRDTTDNGLGAQLAAEWLEKFSDLPVDQEAELIDKLVRVGRFEDLRSIVVNRLGIANNERRRNWDVVGLIVNFEQTAAQLEASQIEPELIWHIRNRTEDRYSDKAHIGLNSTQLEWIIRNFRSLWPVVNHPLSTSGNTNPWDACEYIFQLIRRLGNDDSEEAMAAMARLRGAQGDGYLEAIKAVGAEQTRRHIEEAYVPPSLGAINAIARDILPETSADLQTLVVEELQIVQAKIKSDDAESWRGFYDDNGAPFDEERCRDHLLGLLRQGSKEITYEPETHVADDKEVDIACSAGQLRMPIEIKGQWHRELWKSADKQLDRFYTPDWRAERRGIYLVLWFGDQQQSNKKLKSPGRGVKTPQTSGELRNMLVVHCKSAREGRVIIFVINLERFDPKAE